MSQLPLELDVALKLSSGKWNLIRNGVCNVTLELSSVLDDEIDATLKMRCNKTEPWVPDDCLKPLLFGVFIHSQPNPILTKGPYLTPEESTSGLPGCSSQVCDVAVFI